MSSEVENPFDVSRSIEKDPLVSGLQGRSEQERQRGRPYVFKVVFLEQATARLFVNHEHGDGNAVVSAQARRAQRGQRRGVVVTAGSQRRQEQRRR